MNEAEQSIKKSPLREMPLRLPGQSTDELLKEKWDSFEPYLAAAALAIALAVAEWWRLWTNQSPSPKTYTVVALIVIGLFIFRLRKFLSLARQIKQGRDGERIVAEYLEKMRAYRYQVLHDVVAGDFNVDHVLIGPAGIFAVETKTPSKIGRNNQIQFNGEQILIRGRRYAGNPVTQAKANAKWLNGILKSSTGKNFWVTPIVVFPDWSVRREVAESEVLVLNPKEIEKTLTSRKGMLTGEEISLATFHLEQFVRSRQRKL